RSLLDEARDAHNGSVRAVRRTESVANEYAIAERRELLGKRFVVLFFFGMKTDVFQKQHATVAQALALGLGIGAYAILGEVDGPLEEILELRSHRGQRIFGIGPALGTAEVGRQNQSASLLDGQTQRGQSFADTRVVRNDAVLQ